MPPTFRIYNTGYRFDWANYHATKDPHCFLFFGSDGMIHKGLDLLLELFAEELYDCTLFVCGRYENEKDFLEEYNKELFQTNNIIPVGFVDISTDKYKEISSRCAYSLLPSCAEACAGSVLTNMSSGIIPIVSKECGFDDDEVINMPNCRKETIRKYILDYSHKDSQWLEIKSRECMEIVKERYSDVAFTKSVEEAIDGVLTGNKGDLIIKNSNNKRHAH